MKFKMTKERWILGLVAVVLMFATVGALDRYVTQFGILQVSQNEFRDSDSTSRFFIGSRNIFNGSIAHGDSSTTSSITLPTSSTGANFAHQVPVYNPTASAISDGAILISSDTGAGYVNVAPVTESQTGIIGVAAGSISAASNGWMVPRGGGYAVVLTTHPVSAGDVLVSTSPAGYVAADNTPTSGADVAVAMEDSSGGEDSILAIVR